MPSSNKAYLAMMQLADETGNGAIVDLGSGWGSFVIRIATRYPHRKIIGYELSYLPWLISTILKKLLKLHNLTLHRQNFYLADLSNVSVVVCYLFPEAMVKISNKLQLEQSNVTFLISNNFALPYSIVTSQQISSSSAKTPLQLRLQKRLQQSKVIHLTDFYKSPVYLYELKTDYLNGLKTKVNVDHIE
ncbi:class I SAM-dependent methyltransferase [Colwellia echini]|uniref:Class I SAM-dependent methyltransferase n=1 Tax=Colwellia echini TaxID=1982103 RepID=A0ABY3MXB4_9GAMM|nr:class I SAM-dependent methyltransferase [Colwellia echini]TYK65855.1 class I SAM-dependent methyltransferase [Colwellia echini]